jgi:2-methylcitrate dehydratase PrpD
MVKDGSGWGAMCGVSAARMAKAGFTGAPALTLQT